MHAGPLAAERAVGQAAGAGRADDRHRGAGHGHGLSRAAALAGADGPGLRSAAGGRDRRRARLCADRRVGGARARRPLGRRRRARAPVWSRRAPRRRRDPAPARRGAGQIIAAGARAASGADPARAGTVRPTRARSAAAAATAGRWRPVRPRGLIGAVAAHPGRVLAVAAVLAVGGLGGRHPDRRAVRRDQARAAEHAGAAQPAHARARDRGLGRDRRARSAAPTSPAPTVVSWMIRYENQLLTPLRLPRDARLRALDPVPGAVAARPVLDRQPGDQAERGVSPRRRSISCWPRCRPTSRRR